MPNTLSIMRLHLRYRLWIAEMNSDINVLRILEDYLTELRAKNNEPEVKNWVEGFQGQFVNLRKEIDELRHEMHLVKMKLAAYSKEMKVLDPKTYQADNHAALRTQYLEFRKRFDKTKKDFEEFESKWP